jgi:quinol monooxygenase YgiN
MINVTIKMTVPADKHNEILDAIKSLIVQIRCHQDCISCNCYQDVEADNVIVFEQEWKTKESLTAHLKSGHFKVLRGLMKLLSIEPEISYNTQDATQGVEAKSVDHSG